MPVTEDNWLDMSLMEFPDWPWSMALLSEKQWDWSRIEIILGAFTDGRAMWEFGEYWWLGKKKQKQKTAGDWSWGFRLKKGITKCIKKKKVSESKSRRKEGRKLVGGRGGSKKFLGKEKERNNKHKRKDQ